MKYFSMFSGIGGFEYGISKAVEDVATKDELCDRRELLEGGNSGRVLQKTQKATCIGFSEIDKYAKQIYQTHFKEHKDYGDCTKIKWEDVEAFDTLVGGFPCQAFSIAGKRGGFDDTRGTLFFEIARCLREKQPRLFLLENVKGLLSHDKGQTFVTILTTLDELGYDCQWQVLNSKNFGVPQNRERVFIIGHLRGTSRPEVFPLGESSGLLNKSKREGEESVPLASTITKNYHKGVHGCGETYITKDTTIRRLTPTECERLQGFPDGWTEKGVDLEGNSVIISDTQRYKVLGNAVTTNVIKEIMCKLVNCL